MALENLFFLAGYNNYYNRIVKKNDTLEGYRDNIIYNINNYNFNPNDGVDTEVVVNYNEAKADYLIVSGEDNTINSRWFVIDAKRLRNGQYRFILHRDVIVDNYNIVINAPMFIEKAYIQSVNDPAIYNRENFSVNQIKKNEVLLQDATQSAWLVGWFSADMTKEDITQRFADKFNLYGNENIDYVDSNVLTDYAFLNREYNAMLSDDYMSIVNAFSYQASSTSRGYASFEIKTNTGYSYQTRVIGGAPTNPVNYAITPNTKYPSLDTLKNLVEFGRISPTRYGIKGSANDNYSYIVNAMRSKYSIIDSSSLNIYNRYVNKVFKDSTTNKYYVCKRTITSNEPEEIDESPTSALGLALKRVEAFVDDYRLQYTSGNFKGMIKTSTVKYELIETTKPSGVMTADVSNITPNVSSLNDAPYCAFCIPYSDNITFTNGSKTFITNKNASLAAASLIGKALQEGEFLYDVQLLPYCPMLADNELFIDSSNRVDYSNINSTRIIEFNDSSNNIITSAFIFFNSTFSNNIEYSIVMPTTPKEIKVANETKMYRLCSPNYSNYYNVEPYMNNGVSQFNYDCTYKPYKSYIHVAPQFGGLFGNIQDQRGLIITSEFSVPMINDAYEKYQIENKNYSQIFERQIQNMNVSYKWQRAESIFSAISGTVSGTAAGVAGGAMSGGPLGAIVGGTLGTAASAVGGIADLAMQSALHKEAIDYTRDLFNYQLQNIQALPDTISSVSSFDANTRLFPFIEMYDCTDIEREALENKIEYNGMTIGRIGTMNDFIDANNKHYLKGQLIRIENEYVDTHELNAIYDELFKGVFI